MNSLVEIVAEWLWNRDMESWGITPLLKWDEQTSKLDWYNDARSLLLTLQENGVRVLDENQTLPDSPFIEHSLSDDVWQGCLDELTVQDKFVRVKPLVEG